MSAPPDPHQVYTDTLKEGRRRLDMPPLEQVSSAFIAGVTIVFGILALGVVASLFEPSTGPEAAKALGALAFGFGFVFLVMGRNELFTENFSGPVAAVIEPGARYGWLRLLRLWLVVLLLNLVGGAVLIGIASVEGALPPAATETLVHLAEDSAGKSVSASFARALLAGTLLTLLSFLLHAVDSATARIVLAFMVGFLVELGPFDHVVVTDLHLLFGRLNGGGVSWADIGTSLGVATAGNLIGGVLLITLTHTAQAKAARAAG